VWLDDPEKLGSTTGIRALIDGEQFNAPLAFVVLGIVTTVGFWLVAIDSSRIE
jgi:hypothetical protein